MTGAPAGSPTISHRPNPTNYSEMVDALTEAYDQIDRIDREFRAWIIKANNFHVGRRTKFTILSLHKATTLLQQAIQLSNRLEADVTNIASTFDADEQRNVNDGIREIKKTITKYDNKIGQNIINFLNGERVILADGKEYEIYDHTRDTAPQTHTITIRLRSTCATGTAEEKTINLLTDRLDHIRDTSLNLTYDARTSARLILESGIGADSDTVSSLFPAPGEIDNTDVGLATVSSKTLRYNNGELVVTSLAFSDKKESQEITNDVEFEPGTDEHAFYLEPNKVFTITSKQEQVNIGGVVTTQLRIVSVEPVALALDDIVEEKLDSFKDDILTPEKAEEIARTLLYFSPTAIRKEIKNDFGVSPKLPWHASAVDKQIRRFGANNETTEDNDLIAKTQLKHENEGESPSLFSKGMEYLSSTWLGKRFPKVFTSDAANKRISAAKERTDQLLTGSFTGDPKDNSDIETVPPVQEAEGNSFFGKFWTRLSDTFVGKWFPRLFTSDSANKQIAAASTRSDELAAKTGPLSDTDKDNSDIPTVTVKEYEAGDETLIPTARTYLRGNEYKNERRVAIATALAALSVFGVDRAHSHRHTAHQPNAPIATNHTNRAPQPNGGTPRTNVEDAGISDLGNTNDLAETSATNSVNTGTDNTIMPPPNTQSRVPTTNAIDASVPTPPLALTATTNQIAGATLNSAPADSNASDPRSIGRDVAPANDDGQSAAADAQLVDIATQEPLVQPPVTVPPQEPATPNPPLVTSPLNFRPGIGSGDINGALRAHPEGHNDSRERFVVHGVDNILSTIAPGLTGVQHSRIAGGIGHLIDDQITTYLADHPVAARRFGRIHHGDHGHVDIEEVPNRDGRGSHRVFHIQLQRPDSYGIDHTVLDLKIPESRVQGIINYHTHTQHDTHNVANNSNQGEHQPARRITQRIHRLLGENNAATNQGASASVEAVPNPSTPTTPPVTTQSSQGSGGEGVRRVVQRIRRLPGNRQVAAERVVANVGAEVDVAGQQVQGSDAGRVATNTPPPSPAPEPLPRPTLVSPPQIVVANTTSYERNVLRTVERFTHLSESQKEALQSFISRFNAALSSLPHENSGNLTANLEYNSHGLPFLNIDISTNTSTAVRAQIPFLVVSRADNSIDLETDTRVAVLPRTREEEVNTSLISFGVVPTAQTNNSLHLDRINTGIYGNPRVGKHTPLDRALRSVLRQARFINYTPATASEAPQISAIQPYESNPTAREAIIGALMTAIRETLNTRTFGHTPRRPVHPPRTPDIQDLGDDPSADSLNNLGLKADSRAVDDAERDRLLREIDQMYGNPPSQSA